MTGKVPSFSPGSTVSSTLPGYIALCLALQVHRLASAQFTVIGPDHPVTVSLGGEAILPCHLSPRMSAENMEVRWFRSQDSAVVHLYRDGQDQYEEQMLEYQGRTELLKDDITSGTVSLKIRDIRLSDNGQYSCYFQSSASHKNAFLELQVAGLGSAPAISVEGCQDGGIHVACRSSGWYPEPEVLWRDLQGKLLPSASEEISPEANGLFQTEIAVVLTEETNQKVSCCVRNPRLNQERRSEISIAELFFPRVNPWTVALGLILPLLVGLTALASYCFWRQRRVKETLRLDKESKKETLLSEWEGEKEALRSEMERQKEALRSAMERQKAEYEAAKELGLTRAQGYAVNMTLDPDTAHPILVLSEDWKSVRCGDTEQNLPDNPERFDTWPCVLGCEGFTAGRHCWEVEVGDGRFWAVGVARESVGRKGWIRLSPEGGIWAVGWLGQFQALTSPVTPLPLSRAPSRIRVCLDCDRGQVTFIGAGDEAPIFAFPPGSVPGERIRPWLRVGSKSLLRLCP
ncbi:butyrophilin subfamily 1 member A1-like isoform X5 [Dermochelys coriacea]|uniref:butyrophilin subfamily 1 member A1-like isoform X5 n=1 Tax=Dermochelys coriacea TaxID=27794 RepID=UPI001CA9B9F0|nr:butyrophilin subfamily 1 member A1-like isoform X5 [Dermochelys coriacea]